MRGYDILQRWKRLDGKDREKAVGFFLGGEGMEFEGFTDSDRRAGFPFARHSLDRFEESIGYAERGRVEIMVDMQPIEMETIEPGFRNDWGPGWLHAAAEPVMSKAGVVSGADFPRTNWLPVLILAIVVFLFWQAITAFGAGNWCGSLCAGSVN